MPKKEDYKEWPHKGFGCQVAIGVCLVYAIPLTWLAGALVYSWWTGAAVVLIPPHD